MRWGFFFSIEIQFLEQQLEGIWSNLEAFWGFLYIVKMREVILHVYDVTNSESEKTNNVILQINKIFKDGIGLGGIFHGAVQVYTSNSPYLIILD